jgi:hypothetical protein
MSGVAEKWAEEQLAKIDKEIDSKTADLKKEMESRTSGLVAQRDELAAELKRLQRGKGSSNGTPPIPEGDIVKAIGDLGGGPASSSDIAKQLGGIDVRKIARKLAKMGSDAEVIIGDKDSGYSLV